MTWINPDSEEVRRFLKENGCAEQFLPLRIEGSSRNYYRVRKTDEGSGAANLILCLQAPFVAEAEDFLAVQTMLEKARIPVPQIIATLPEKGMILQSDGGENDLEAMLPELSEQSQTEPLYLRIVDCIIAMQDMPLEAPVSGRYFNKEKLYWEMEFLFERLERAATDFRIDIVPAFELKMFLLEACDALGHQDPQVFTHRDLHSRNILLDSSDSREFTIIDFQDARAGNRFYDLASLVFDPYASLSREVQTACIDYYFQKCSLEKGRGILYLQGLQRVLKALGSYLYLGREMGKADFLNCIPPALDQLEGCLHLGRFPDSVFLFILDCKRKLLPALSL
ncbi:MAG: phosphotransferase [Leptospiraceae bacterium]|nr:phosphotransferase [Leptospiraceae bacterium]